MKYLSSKMVVGIVLALSLAAILVASPSEACPPSIARARLALQRIFTDFPQVYQDVLNGQLGGANTLPNNQIPGMIPNQQIPGQQIPGQQIPGQQIPNQLVPNNG